MSRAALFAIETKGFGRGDKAESGKTRAEVEAEMSK